MYIRAGLTSKAKYTGLNISITKDPETPSDLKILRNETFQYDENGRHQPVKLNYQHEGGRLKSMVMTSVNHHYTKA